MSKDQQQRDYLGRFMPRHGIGVAHRFRPGQPSANPRGRPWGEALFQIWEDTGQGPPVEMGQARFSISLNGGGGGDDDDDDDND